MAAGRKPFTTFVEFKGDNAVLSKDAFVKKHPTTFLLLNSPIDEGDDVEFHTYSPIMNTKSGTRDSRRRTHAIVHKLAKQGEAEYFMVTVGRTSNNDVHIPHSQISKFHAYFNKDHVTGRTMLADAGSTNRTQVNQDILSPNEPRLLENGDKVVFGGEVRGTFFTAEGMWELITKGGFVSGGF